ncbi:hypothetical protein QQS21_006351 [Conoideocrella luteorostrata]|uniref:Tetratricopeptide repeat protein n=1 Tax=Conoideocrella luteorostrata TaxID=1105319 RepID=A0AAJ0G087_9HYPO|nr:hypothetical protein QQS21_006351 [Conoideocrella luteorostrata]
MENPQEEFKAATELLLQKFPSQRSNKYDNDEWILYEHYIPQLLALARNYIESQVKPNPLRPTMDFVSLLANAANAIHDNDTTNSVPGLLKTADSAFNKCPEDTQDRLLEMAEGLEIWLELLPHDDLLLALAYSWLGMAVGGQERYEEGIDLLLKAGKILEGPAGEIPTRKLVWGYNTSRNYYCMGHYDKAEHLLNESLEDAYRLQSWYMQV